MMPTPLTINRSPALPTAYPAAEPPVRDFVALLGRPKGERDVAQLAALLLSISRNNAYEGRDPRWIPDNLASRFVADLLGVDVATLADALRVLEHRGLVRANGHALYLTNLAALETMSGRGLVQRQ